MRLLIMACLCAVVAAGAAQAKKTYSVFSLGFALPMSSAASTENVPVEGTELTVPGGFKDLGTGWEGGWTFFGLPFTDDDNALSGLGFGGKVSYNRWQRDSTMKELVFLGVQGIARYYPPIDLDPFELFVQGGIGMFIGEHGFADPDTIPVSPPPSELIVTEGKKNAGVSVMVGMDWDVIEVSPGVTVVLTSGKPSMWFSMNAAMKF